jgi:mRNA interferase MazF
MARILRGDVRWADLNPVRGHEQAGQRPVLVLSHDVFNDRSGTVIAIAMTSQEPRAGFPLTLESKAVGLKKRSWIKISQIRTLSVDRIGTRLARASEEELARVPLQTPLNPRQTAPCPSSNGPGRMSVRG